MAKPLRVTIEGVEDTIRGHAFRHGIAVATVRQRIKRGWDVESALLVPTMLVGARGKVTPELRATIAKRLGEGVSATSLADRYGISRRHVYRLADAEAQRQAASFAEEWDDITYWVPTHDGRPALYADDGDVLVTVHRDQHNARYSPSCLTLRYRPGVGYVDKESCPYVIREEIREALLSSFESAA